MASKAGKYDSHDSRNKKAILVLTLVAGFAVFWAFYKNTICKSCSMNDGIALFKSVELDQKVDELKSLSLDVSPFEIRQWLLKEGPEVTEKVLSLVDGTIDRTGKVRIETLHSIYSLHFSTLPEGVEIRWAYTLRALALKTLHEGDLQTDFLAKSLIMEGKRDRAAEIYKDLLRFPRGTYGRNVAENFFHSNPELRKPASSW